MLWQYLTVNRQYGLARLVAGGEHGVQVGRSEAVAHQVQGRSVGAALAHRVGAGEQVATLAIGVDVFQHLELLGHGITRAGAELHTGEHRMLGTGQFKALEEPGPAGVYGRRILEEMLVLLVEPCAIDVAEVGILVHGWGPGDPGTKVGFEACVVRRKAPCGSDVGRLLHQGWKHLRFSE